MLPSRIASRVAGALRPMARSLALPTSGFSVLPSLPSLAPTSLSASGMSLAPAAGTAVFGSGFRGFSSGELPGMNDKFEAQLREYVFPVIDDIIADNRVVLFMKGTPTRPECGYSRLASTLLKHHKIEFEGVDVLADPAIRAAIKVYSDWPTIPQLYVDGGNLDEDGFLCYFCKAGDGVADVQLLADLHKSEVFAVGHALAVPESILIAPPSADLWDGQTDEDEIGYSYDAVELYTALRAKDPRTTRDDYLAKVSPDAQAEYEAIGTRLEAIHHRNSHKANFPKNLNILTLSK
ncbi:NAD(+) synthetase [Kipferlia bialata]|uniref:NAD(+) synthetase n=1 Tax=Kipferlia bialata TaxID=797122 RepID=A0A9K3GL64_9EUKA|nr:NAD(+) synthetase [Kipferlia bialata]|eukprot:g8263.t1